MPDITPAALKRGQRLYIFEAALEYFVSLLFAGSFLATLTKSLGFSDSLTGILSSLISLGCVFQLLSLMFRPRRSKRFVLILSIANQLLFMLLYVIPLWQLSSTLKTILFIGFIVLAYLFYYIAHPRKISWLMSLVDNGIRGTFTANKEIFSLFSGMLFTFAMSAIGDHYKALGNTRAAFVIFAVVLFLLTVLHSLCLIFTPEQETAAETKQKLLPRIRDMLKNRKLLRIVVVFILFQVAIGVCTPFYGTYHISELGFSLTLVSVLTVIGNLSRMAVSPFLGRYADRKSFLALVEKCLLIFSLALLSSCFAVPKTGIIPVALYYILRNIAYGGISSATINLVYDYVTPENRADAMAVCQAVSGLAGFFATLLASRLVTVIQSNGNTLFGIPMYAQQLLSGIGVIIMLFAVLYIGTVKKKNSATETKRSQ